MLRAVERLLRPLIRLLIQGGVTFPLLADAVRALYVDVARTEMLTGDRARTDSRVSLLTGVHRKELRRQRAPAAETPEPPIVTRTSAILARWLGGQEYTAPGQDGPMKLPRLGPAPSFEALVSSVTRDVRPRAVLEELLDAGTVRIDEAGLVVLDQAAFLPRDGDEALAYYFARNLHDHMAVAAGNMLAGTAPFLDRSVHYDGISLQAAAALERVAREAAIAMLLTVNRAALAIAEADDAARQPGAPTRRVNLGVYLLAADDAGP